jgi:hypothetical protein
LPVDADQPACELRYGRAGLEAQLEHGLPVTFAGSAELVGTEVQVAIEEASAFGLAGTMPC